MNSILIAENIIFYLSNNIIDNIIFYRYYNLNRYFTPGIIIAMLHSPFVELHTISSKVAALLSILILLGINIMTMYIFTQKVFINPIDGTISRFMY